MIMQARQPDVGTHVSQVEISVPAGYVPPDPRQNRRSRRRTILGLDRKGKIGRNCVVMPVDMRDRASPAVKAGRRIKARTR